MKMIYLGHSAFLFETSKGSFVIDPYQDDSVPGLTMKRVTADAVFTSHDHFDHNAVELVSLTGNKCDIDYEIVMVPHDKENGKKRGMNKIHIFNVDGYRIAHFGDIGCIPNKETLNKLMNLDIVLSPINGFFTISAEELHEVCEIIKPRITIPIHYYKKENNSGYPDGNQIDIFKILYPNYKKVNSSLEINEELFDNNVLIFE